ncbi:galactokinase [Friedmanniella endophytica]|uniref:Galactokinase n=1 Tax=Microlunatus kandeliicorticis TaxID=1759536 RepID=A0A7W3P735_9ACTN|nr:galactokinase [Microlunatus kandeliicorticis]MBA8795582.1 galactokinase [Microlunatus kandeliicorticis]
MPAHTDAETAAIDQVVTAFRDAHGSEPAGVWAGPGRVNLIGEHTDYNDGFVMPFALAQQVTVAAGPRTDGTWTVASLQTDHPVAFGPDDLVPGMAGWAAYAAGVVWALREAGHRVDGADLVLSSDVPLGAGLSSSAALECGVLTALADLNGLEIDGLERAKLARRCENVFVGAPTGLLDQAASTLCTADHALLFDCRSNATEQVPLALGDAGLELLVLDTKTPHSHVDGEYAERRASCDRAAELLGVAALRDVTDADLEGALTRLAGESDGAVLQRRVRHVVTEDDRVLRARRSLAEGDWTGFAALLDASHVSMRDDFEITVPTVDLAVTAAREAGALGARMTGGGFGGCIIALVPAGSADRVAGHVAERFAEAGFGAPAHFVGVPSAGARRLR